MTWAVITLILVIRANAGVAVVELPYYTTPVACQEAGDKAMYDANHSDNFGYSYLCVGSYDLPKLK